MAQHYGLDAAGYYTLVLRVLSLPSALVGQSVADAFHNRIAALKVDEPQAVEPFFIRTVVWLLAIGAVPTLVLLVAGPRLFAAIFGPNWKEAGEVAAAMTVWFIAGFAVSPVSRVVFVFQDRSKFTYDLLSLAATLGAFVWGTVTGASFVTVVWVLSVTNALAYVAYLILLLHTVRKGVRVAAVSFRHHLRNGPLRRDVVPALWRIHDHRGPDD